MTKIVHGGWLPLLIALVVFTIMMTWQRGRVLVTERRTEMEGTLAQFIAAIPEQQVTRVAGVAVFPHAGEDTAPLALRLNVEQNHVMHTHVVVISAKTANVPHITWSERLRVDHLGDPADGIVHITAEFGFQDRSDIPAALIRANADHLEGALDLESATYFLSSVILHRSHQPGMSTWRKQLFTTLANNTIRQADYLCLPDDRTVIMGSQLDF